MENGVSRVCEQVSSSTLVLRKGDLRIEIERPGAPGNYCGPRFSWAGILSRVEWRGAMVFGPWRAGEFPPHEHDRVSGTAGEFGMGNAGMPPPPGFDEAGEGGHFVKIGVGVLRRPDKSPYVFYHPYEVTHSPPWQIEAAEDRVAMLQRVTSGDCGYEYRYELFLEESGSAFVTRHHLKNTGRAPLHQTHYAHNFIVLDGRPVDGGLELEFTFSPQASFNLKGTAVVEGRFIRFRNAIPDGKALYTEIAGFGTSVAENGVVVRRRDTGMALSITGDCPITRYHLFATPCTVCPEPFVSLSVAPGESFSWQHRYQCSMTPAEKG